MEFDTVVDGIYEAALVPERWPAVIASMAAVSGSTTGCVYVTGPDFGARAIGSKGIHELIQKLATQPERARESLRIVRAQAMPRSGFVRAHDLLSTEELEQDPIHHALHHLGLDGQSSCNVLLPNGESACFTFERGRNEGLHTPQDIERLNQFNAHLGRAAIIAMRLRLEQAQSMVGALEAVGLPAAALTAQGQALAVNLALERSVTLRPAAFGRISLASPAADALFQQALAQANQARVPVVRSIPIQAAASDAPGGAGVMDGVEPRMVLHLVPIRGAAHDIFSRIAYLLVATSFGAKAVISNLSLLHGLFDLTPKETQLAATLASGITLKQAAAHIGMQYSTARKHLEHVFQKTGTRQQSQLVLLLQGARAIAPE